MSGANRFGSRRPHAPAHGFTLLELIIALTLASLLMVLVWSLFSTYTRLEERSSRTAVELQLVRSVSRQLRSDLEHFAVLPLPSPIEISGGNASGTQNGSTDGSSANSDSDSTDAGSADSDSADSNAEENTSESDESTDNTANETLTPIEPLEPNNATLGSGTTSTGGGGGGGAAGGIAPSVNIVDTDFTEADVFTTTTFDASLPDQTYLKGNATRLEIVTRLPYTVDVPSGQQLIGAEARYGTHHLVIYDFRKPRQLETLLKDDPVLNPSKFNPPPPLPVTPDQSQLPPPVANPLNPNDNVGLIRESKSWLHVTRDQRKEALMRTAEQAGLLVNGELPPADVRQPDDLRQQLDQQSFDPTAPQQVPWNPPPEFKHRMDQIPEVTKLQFRYFDGTEWLLEWQHVDFLPRAIEVAFDLDPDAPAVRAQEFEEAHALMLAGSSLTDVLPEDLEGDVETEFETGLDALETMNLADPTAIVTEYRFVIQLPFVPQKKRDREERESDEGALGDSIEGQGELMAPAAERSEF